VAEKTPSFVRSENHTIVYNLLVAAEVGDLVTYAKMREMTGVEVHGGTGFLRTALNRALKEEEMVFRNEPLKGYKRLSPEETVDNSDEDRARLHRHARRSRRKLETADAEFPAMDQRHKLKFAINSSLLAVIEKTTTKFAAKRLEKAVVGELKPLPFQQTFEALIGPQTRKKED
jgi:hypothetical protein